MLRRIHLQGTAVGAVVAQPLLVVSENGQARALATWTAPVAGCIAKVIICNDTAAQQNSITIVRGNHGGRNVVLQAPGDLVVSAEMGIDFMQKLGFGIAVEKGEVCNFTGNMVGASVCDVFIEYIDGGASADFVGVRVAGAAAAVADADIETGANLVAALPGGKTCRLVAFYGLGAATTKSFGVGLNDKGIATIQAKSVVVNDGQPYEWLRPDIAALCEDTTANWQANGRIFINDSAATAAANQLLVGLFVVG